MDNDIQHIGILTEFSVEHVDKLEGGTSIVSWQESSGPPVPRPVFWLLRGVERHRLLEGRNALLAASLFGQADRLLRG